MKSYEATIFFPAIGFRAMGKLPERLRPVISLFLFRLPGETDHGILLPHEVSVPVRSGQCKEVFFQSDNRVPGIRTKWHEGSVPGHPEERISGNLLPHALLHIADDIPPRLFCSDIPVLHQPMDSELYNRLPDQWPVKHLCAEKSAVKGASLTSED